MLLVVCRNLSRAIFIVFICQWEAILSWRNTFSQHQHELFAKIEHYLFARFLHFNCTILFFDEWIYSKNNFILWIWKRPYWCSLFTADFDVWSRIFWYLPRCFDTTAIFFWWNFNFEEVLFYRPNLSWVYIKEEEECYNTIDYNILDYDTFCNNYFEKQTKVINP